MNAQGTQDHAGLILYDHAQTVFFMRLRFDRSVSGWSHRSTVLMLLQQNKQLSIVVKTNNVVQEQIM